MPTLAWACQRAERLGLPRFAFCWYAGGMSESPTPKLRWYQFSLRSLLLFVLACSLVCSWLGVKMQRAREQKQAVEADDGVKKLQQALPNCEIDP